MRIISSFKDYYDCHQDKETLFLHKEEEIGLELGKWLIETCRDRTHHTFRDLGTAGGILFVAGKGYPYRQDTRGKPRFTPILGREDIDRWLYSTKFTLPEEYAKYPIRPTWLCHKHSIYINVNLSKLGFAKVLSNYEVYQELTMFFNNLSSPEKEMAKLSDKSLAIKHGFDKWSFRRKA